MKFRWLLLFLLGLPAVAQPHGPPAMATSFVQYMSGPAACQVAAVYFDQTQHKPYYCYPANTWVAFGGSSSGVSQLIAGANITLDPSGGTGVVTINATGGSGPVQTCDASTVALYGYGRCTGQLTATQLLAISGGGAASAIYPISAPGSGKISEMWNIAMHYVAGTAPFSAVCNFFGAAGGVEIDIADGAPIDCTQDTDQYSFASGGYATSSGVLPNSQLGIYVTGSALTGGPVNQIATSSVDSSGDATSVPNATITAGQAGLLYAPGDGIWLACASAPMWQVATVDDVTGAVTSIVPVGNGTGCTPGNGQATSTDNAGSGLELDVATVDAGWAVNDTFQETSCATTSATGHITSVAPTTKLITGFAIDTPGAGCTVGGGDILVATSGNSFAGTNDTNGTISIDSVTSDFVSIYYAIDFQVVPVPGP